MGDIRARARAVKGGLSWRKGAEPTRAAAGGVYERRRRGWRHRLLRAAPEEHVPARTAAPGGGDGARAGHGPDHDAAARTGAGRGLSQKLLLLTIAFVLLGEVLIYVPSVARFRVAALRERIGAAHIASLASKAGGGRPQPELEARLLGFAGVRSVTLHWPAETELMLGAPESAHAVYDLRAAGPLDLVRDAFLMTLRASPAPVRVLGVSPHDPRALVDVTMDDRGLRQDLLAYATRVLTLSIILSLVVALLIFISLRLMIVRPLRRITAGVAVFRRRPESDRGDLPPTRRRDEIGVIQDEIARMQRDIRGSLAGKTRLAGLGEAVGKINHDLRNILTSAILISDRLEGSSDPEVRRVTPRLVAALERAARLCGATLSFAHVEGDPPRRRRFALGRLVDEVGEAALEGAPRGLRWRNEVDERLIVEADRDRLFRALLNLGRNAVRALAGRPEGEIVVAARRVAEGVTIEVADTGPGVPEAAREHLFRPFAVSTDPDGAGLGLAIARELLRAHGGDAELVRTGGDGTVFRLTLPDP